MVTYKDAAQVVRYRCVNQQAKKVDSKAIFPLHAVYNNMVLLVVLNISQAYQKFSEKIVKNTNPKLSNNLIKS